MPDNARLVIIRLDKDTITPELQRLIDTCRRPRALFAAGGKAMQKEISDHLRRLQNRGNIKGWPSQKFFAGKSTSVERNVGVEQITDTGAIVTIADPRFVHRIAGGPVFPKRGKYLAIPLTAEAYAKSGKGTLRESMPGLFVVKFPRGLFLCRQVESRTRAGASGGRKFNTVKSLRVLPLFKLVRTVTHRPRPEELPDVAKLGAAARAAMTAAARLLLRADK